MAVSDDTRLGGRVPAVLRIRLKHASVDAFIERFSVNISRGGIFIASRTPQPVGTVLRFEFQLSQGTPVVRGEGEVLWVKAFDPEAPTKPHGMGVRFTRIDTESRAVIDRALAWKEAHGGKRRDKEGTGETRLPAEEVKPGMLPPEAITEVEALPPPKGSLPLPGVRKPLAGPPPLPPPRQRKMTMPPPIPDDAPSSIISSSPPPRAAKPTRSEIDPLAVTPPPELVHVAPPQVEPRPPRAKRPPLPEPPPRARHEPHSGNGTDLDSLAVEWGMSDERIAQTIARVRADPPATTDEEIARLAETPPK